MTVIGCQRYGRLCVFATNTERAYRADRDHFLAWCAAGGVRTERVDAATLASYVDDLACHCAPSTVRRRVAGIAAWYRLLGDVPPIDASVRLAVASASWKHRSRRHPTEPLGVPELRAISAALPDTIAGARDRALLLVGYGAALRRTELVGLDVTDVRRRRDGAIAVTVPRGRIVVPPGSSRQLCAVRAWQEWVRTARVTDGPAFRPIDRHGNIRGLRLSDRAVTLIVQRAAARAGLDGTRYTGRSLRRGMILAAAAVGASDDGIMAQTGRRSRRLVREYRALGYVPGP